MGPEPILWVDEEPEKSINVFRPHHAIYKFADYYDELEDYLPYAESLIEWWSSCDSPVNFTTTFDIQIAVLLLHDDLLPEPAIRGLGVCIWAAIGEARDKRYSIEALQITPPPPGRKRDDSMLSYCWGVRELLEEGASKTKAYAAIAEKHSKSPDTIRRAFERAEKKKRDRGAKKPQ